ncbi:MAG: hypothetical protein DDT18_01098 [Actinobacteria bacterium]|nr:hypothetical protein [Actinomycetota bacterium]
MKKEIIITDFSKMPEGVCVFGYDEEGSGIRPVIFNIGEKEKGLLEDYVAGIEPFMRVEFEFIKPQPNPPHMEDWLINEDCRSKIIRTLLEDERKEFLKKISYNSMEVADWGTEIHLYLNKRGENIPYINPGEGKKSIITIKPKNISSIEYSKDANKLGKYNYRITFSDMIGYNLSITDLLFREYCDNLRNQGKSCGAIGTELQRKLNQSDVFLRIGAGRCFIPKGSSTKGCFLFVTGIYSFPDYKK